MGKSFRENKCKSVAVNFDILLFMFRLGANWFDFVLGLHDNVLIERWKITISLFLRPKLCIHVNILIFHVSQARIHVWVKRLTHTHDELFFIIFSFLTFIITQKSRLSVKNQDYFNKTIPVDFSNFEIVSSIRFCIELNFLIF